MRKQILSALLGILMILGCNTSGYAEGLEKTYDLSPAMEILSKSLGMKRSVVKGSAISFDGRDFEEVLGRSVEYITVTSLPDPSVGTLTFAGSEIAENQSFTRRNLALLRFNSSGTVGSTSFGFCGDGGVGAVCTVNALENANSSPTATDAEYRAVSGVGLTRSFEVSDPDGDRLVLEIVDYPENGTVTTGGSSFVYTAAEGFSGKDGFTYRALDSNGASALAKVTVSVSSPKSGIAYGDMSGHWGHTSAMRLTELGLITPDSEGNFNPEDGIGRGDFLAMAMICAGLEDEVSLGAVTTFADDAQIPSNIRSYASYAKACGIVSGYRASDGRAVFGSDGEITRAEAARVLANILGESPRIHEFDFVDAAAVPSWAKDSFSTLVSLGIINGTPDGVLAPDRALTRAEAARMLCNTVDFIEEKQQERSEGFFERLANLFKA